MKGKIPDDLKEKCLSVSAKNNITGGLKIVALAREAYHACTEQIEAIDIIWNTKIN